MIGLVAFFCGLFVGFGLLFFGVFLEHYVLASVLFLLHLFGCVFGCVFVVLEFLLRSQLKQDLLLLTLDDFYRWPYCGPSNLFCFVV